jgi:GAF domain-containing protein
MTGASSMNKPDSFTSKDDRLLAKVGGRYIQLSVGRSQAASLFIGPPIGLLFTYVTANLSSVQFTQFIVSLVVFIILANLLPPIFTRRGTRQAIARLDHIYKNIPLPEDNDAILAWKEIITLPGRIAISQLLSALFLVTLPVIIFMRVVGGVSWFQVASIATGGSLTVMAMLIQSVLNMDNRLGPVRRALLPTNALEQDIRLSIGLAARQYFVIGFLLLASQLMSGILVFGKFNAAMLPGANIPEILRQLQIQLGIFGLAIFILGFFLASRLILAHSRPIQEMTHTLVNLHEGDLSQRAAIITSDETAQLTIRLNQLLDQLQASQTGLEKQIEERTKDLSRKTSYLQAASWVAHEAAGLQDINTLLKRTVELISNRFGFYHTGIFLLDDSGEHAVLQAASSEGGQRMLKRGHKLDVGLQGIVGAAAYQNHAQVVMDVEKDQNYYKNPDLPLTRSEAAFPLTARGNILGILDIQATDPSAFSQDDVELLQAMANQIGLAIHNARLGEESNDNLERLEAATTENIRKVWRERLQSGQHSYRYTSMGITSATQVGNKPTGSESALNRLNIPITLRGEPLGTIVLRRTAGNAWSETERSLAMEIAGQVGLALENARLLDEAQRRAAQEQSLSGLAAELSRSLDPSILLQTALRELHQLPNVSGVSVSLSSSEKPAPGDAS